jgi:hypothetical protein
MPGKFWQLLGGREKAIGSKPQGMQDIGLYESPAYITNYQDVWDWPWAPAPAHEQRSALVNCWTGNQMPGYTNFIPGMNQSKFVWNHPTFYMNTPSGQGFIIGNQQYNVGRNIQTGSAIQAGQWQVQAYQAWLNRVPGSY